MQLPFSLVLLISSFAAAPLVQARPAPHRSAPRDINISHKSVSTGTTTTHSIDASLLPAELAAAIEGSDVNINLTTDRVKRGSSSGINNSTINLTVIDSRKKRATAAPAAQHHNIHIDAFTSGSGAIGGFHNSTVNINLNSASSKQKKRTVRRKVNLGDNSVLVDVSSAGASSDASSSAGIEDSTVHVNILPGRALEKATGHHSIVIDSSSLGAEEAAQSTTSTGSHSAVVDTSTSSSSSSASENSTTKSTTASSGVKNSTINLTVISASDEPVDAPIPALSRLSKRSSEAFEAWASAVRSRALAETPEECDMVDEVPDVEAAFVDSTVDSSSSGFVVVRRNHNSKPSLLAAKRA